MENHLVQYILLIRKQTQISKWLFQEPSYLAWIIGLEPSFGALV